MTDSTTAVQSGRTRDFLALAFAIAFPTLVTLVYFEWLEDANAQFQQIAFAIGKIIQFGFPLVWVWLWYRNRLRTFSPFAKDTPEKIDTPSDHHWASKHANGIGVVFGLLVVIAMFGIYLFLIKGTELGNQFSILVQEKVIDMGIENYWQYIAVGIFYALCHSFLEEYYWRWFVFDLLKKFVRPEFAMIISGLGFMAHHVVLLGAFFAWSGTTYLLSICIAIGGVFWAWQYDKTDRLMAPWLSHMIVDAGIFSLGYLIVQSILV
ncbi:CPBP family intramembrane metalloprotease [bacterium]|nr:CPBP family intramembrane metalloprotease [Mariniblastus sp.]MDA7910278.1 CPBP family intramembrane metalloprotease [bacterium]MDA7926112.1 CPBP family intramembrane metalloprotease [Mariniblastus sp.]MDB4396291.1 CPBP family intramembrane metalloprotease [bacterium]MDB4460730.1 CPBP family intramembrane metalloprotease [bacterium]